MKATEKFRHIFGEISHLKDNISWTTGVSNMVEHIVWSTSDVLGISKTQLIRKTIELATENSMKGKSIADIEKYVQSYLKQEMVKTEKDNRYDKPMSGYCTARESLRKIKYFSEDYLNKEFDIFLNLASDSYLDSFYTQFLPLTQGSSWSTHGNSGVFNNSVEIKRMQMDNLAYNHEANLLVANELKLNGQKNKDQILKYFYLFDELVKKQFVEKDIKFVLLFISGKVETYQLKNELEKEIAYCNKKLEKYSFLLEDHILDYQDKVQLECISWQDIVEFNEVFLKENQLSQVERKLLIGFNQSLLEKDFMN